jgi:membrane protein
MAYAEALPRNFRELYAFLRAAAARFAEDRCLQIAGSLTYTTLLALVPLVTVALAIVTAFPVFSQWTGQLDDWMVENVLPEAIGNAVTSYLAQFSEKAARLTTIGIVVLGATALMLMLTIDRAFNQIFRVTRPRPVVQRLLIYWAVLTVGPLLVGASVSMTSYLVSASLGYARGAPILGEALLKLAPLVLTVAAATLLYLVVPNRRVRIRHALIGGAIAGILFELTKRGFALYIAQIPTYALVYGTFAVVPIFLVWLYLSWLVVIFGATITALLPGYRFLHARRNAPGRRFLEALEVLGRLVAAQRRGATVPLFRLAAEAKLAPESCERLLERMAQLGWVARTAAGERWILAREARELTLADPHREFVFDPDCDAELAERLNAGGLLEAHGAALQGALGVSLGEFFAPPALREGETPQAAASTVMPLHAVAKDK